MTPSLPKDLVKIFGKETLKSLQSEPYHREKKQKAPKPSRNTRETKCKRCNQDCYKRKNLVRNGMASMVKPQYSVEEALAKAGL